MSLTKSLMPLLASSLALLSFGEAGADDAKAPQELALRDAVERAPRAGLPNFFKKCAAGGTVEVAYLGGSITAQEGWRVKSLEFLRKENPQAKIEEIYAALGGTGSNFGVFRLDHDVLKRKPDLVFVEFATNDSCDSKNVSKQKEVRRSMEGIVRSVKETNPECDICFVYTIAGEPAQKLLEEGKCSVAATLHEEVASHYGIPSVHMGVEAARLAKEGKLAWKSPKGKVDIVAGKELDKTSGAGDGKGEKIPFSDDGVHPYLDTGHKLYMEALERAWPKIKEASLKARAETPTPAPLTEDYVRKVSFFELENAKLEGDWRKLNDPMSELKTHKTVWITGDVKPGAFIPELWRGAVGATLSFEFTGRGVALYGVAGPGSGFVECEIDGKKTKINFFDNACRFWRIKPLFPASGLDATKTHSFKLTVLGDKFDKKAELSEGSRKFYDLSPASFEPTELHLAGIGVEDGRIVGK